MTTISPRPPAASPATDARAGAGGPAAPRQALPGGASRRPAWVAIGLVALTTWLAWASVYRYSLPVALPASAPRSAFSAARAVAHLDAIARAPRPVASIGHAATAAYIVQEIERLGLEPEIQEAATVVRFPGAERFNAGSVRNVLVRLPGRASSGAIVLDAHYDGAATGPAAADCGACVVTLLETLRALRAAPPLRNDVIFVFADAEEMGDLGAHAFATRHPWMREVRVALNFEAMGTGGPATLYVTSRRNGAVVHAFTHTPRAFAAPLMAELASDGVEPRAACDLTDYMDAGSAGLGFVISGNSPAYHTVGDDADRLDPRSVQHFGGYALGLARYLGERDLTRLGSEPDLVFFNLWPGAVLYYPVSWTLPLALLATLVLTGAIVVGARRGLLQPRRIAGAGAALVASLAGTLAIATAVWWGVWWLDPDLHVFQVGHHALPWHFAALCVLAIACVASAHAALLGRVPATEQLAASLAIFAVLAWLSSAFAPAVSYLFAWPALIGGGAFGWWMTPPLRTAARWRTTALVLLVLVPATLLVLPAGLGLTFAFMARVDAMTGLPAIALPTLFAALLAMLAGPLAAMLADDPAAAREARWGPARVAVLVALVLFAAGTTRTPFSALHPRPSEVRYELDADRGTARWVTSDDRLTEWSAQFIPRGTRRDSTVVRGWPGGPPTFAAAAPALPIAAPDVTIEGDTMLAPVRVLRLRVHPGRPLQSLSVQVEASDSIEAATIMGQLVPLGGYEPAARGRLSFDYAAPPARGIELALLLRGTGSVRLSLSGASNGLPHLPGGAARVRPRATMPTPGATWDGTIVRRTELILGRDLPPLPLAGNSLRPLSCAGTPARPAAAGASAGDDGC